MEFEKEKWYRLSDGFVGCFERESETEYIFKCSDGTISSFNKKFLSGTIEEIKDDIQKLGRKYDGEKLRWDLIPFEALEDVVEVLTFGRKKYASDNWKYVKGRIWRYVGASFRHLNKWWRAYVLWRKTKDEKYRLKGNNENDITMIDFETGKSHIANAICCMLFLLDCEKNTGDDEMEGY